MFNKTLLQMIVCISKYCTSLHYFKPVLNNQSKMLMTTMPSSQNQNVATVIAFLYTNTHISETKQKRTMPPATHFTLNKKKHLQ